MITAKTAEEFIEQFKKYKTNNAAMAIKSVVYIWRTSSDIPRLIGQSNIIYIGQTTQSFKQRYSSKKSLEIETQYFKTIYKHVIDKYGPITIDITETDNPKRDEKKLIHDYFATHSELPPINRCLPPI